MIYLCRILVSTALVLTLNLAAYSITWVPQEFTCPVDGEKNTFLVVASYGSYIYSYPSKYQWLFFPDTDSPTFYICKKCHLATFMWDFDKVPKDKIPELRKVLSGVKISKGFKEYTELPIEERLEIMAKVYSVLGKDEEWWEHFYRVQGYHYGKSGEADKAAAARRKSLELITKFTADPASEWPKKLLLYISGSLKHFLGDDKGALTDLESAIKTPYANKKDTAEDVKAGENGLNDRITDYITRIKSEKDKPRLFDKYSRDEH